MNDEQVIMTLDFSRSGRLKGPQPYEAEVEAEAETHEAEVKTHEVEARTYEAEATFMRRQRFEKPNSL